MSRCDPNGPHREPQIKSVRFIISMIKKAIKNAVRTVIAATGLLRSRLYVKYRVLRGANVSHLLIGDRAGRFSKIYQSGVWLSDNASVSLSGLGSELACTSNIRKELPKLLTEMKVKNLLDIGCGDWTWMRYMELPCDYVGADIVPAVIDKDRREFERAGRKFIILDAVTDPIPVCDAIICREVLFHLSLSDARALIRNILKSEALYLFATTDSATNINWDIITGDFRLLNLQAKPFYFPRPIDEILDDGHQELRRIAVWRLKDLRKQSGFNIRPSE